MNSNYISGRDYHSLMGKIETEYQNTGSFQGLKIKVLNGEGREKAGIKIFGEKLTCDEVSELMAQITEKQKEAHHANPQDIANHLCDRLIKVLEDAQQSNQERKDFNTNETVSHIRSSIDNQKKAQKAKGVENLLDLINEFIDRESENTNDTTKMGTVRFLKQSLERKDDAVRTMRNNLSDSSSSFEAFNEQCTDLELDLLQMVVIFNKQYEGVLIDKLIELSTEKELYKLPPLGENAISLAIRFNDLTALEKIREKFPHSMQKFLQMKSGIYTPLISSVYMSTNREEIARKLLEYGANINFIEPGGRWLLDACVRSSHASAKSKVEFCLSVPEINVNITDTQGRKILHNIILHPVREDVTDVLLSDNRILNQKNEKDAYGYTPLDYAYFYKKDKWIKVLENATTVNTEDPRYGKEPVVVDQRAVRKKMKKYLEATIGDNPNKSQIINKIMGVEAARSGEGFCNGFTFLFLYYHEKGKKELYFEILKELSKWDGNPKSLSIPFEEGRFDNLYTNLGDLFQQTLNDVVWFQSAYDMGGETLQELKQQLRGLQYDTVKNSESDLGLQPVVDNMEMWVNKEQLVEMLDFFNYAPGLVFDLGGASHSTGLVTLPDGKSKYYDSNAHYEVKDLENNHEAADAILNFKYKMINKAQFIISEKKEFGYDEVMELKLQIYRFGSSESEAVPVPALEFDKLIKRESPNGFTPLHVAVLCNDKKRLMEMLSLPNVEINKKDLHGKTALDYAILLNRTDLALELLKKPDADLLSLHSHTVTNLNVSVIKFQNKEVLKAWLVHPKFIDNDLGSLLKVAVEQRSLPILEIILQSGKPVEKLLGNILFENPIDVSLKNQSIEVAHCLLKNHLPPTEKLYEWMCKQVESSPQEVKKMLEAMPDPHLPIFNSLETLRDRAVKDNNHKLIGLLAQVSDSQGAEPSSRA